MSFQNDLTLLYINGTYWKVVEEPLVYIIDSSTKVEVPVGFTTDLASVPQIFWNILPPQGTDVDQYGPSVVVHDYLYKYGHIYNYTDNKYEQIDRKQADNILYTAMTDKKVPVIIKYTIWLGVRLGGSKAWNSYNHSNWQESP